MCFKLLLPYPQMGNNAWEWSYGKHDEQEFTGLSIVWVGTILDGIFWITIIWVGIFQMGVTWVGIFRVRLSGRELSWVGIVRVEVILGGIFLWWEFFGWELSERNIRGWGGGEFSGGSFPSTVKFNQ